MLVSGALDGKSDREYTHEGSQSDKDGDESIIATGLVAGLESVHVCHVPLMPLWRLSACINRFSRSKEECYRADFDISRRSLYISI